MVHRGKDKRHNCKYAPSVNQLVRENYNGCCSRIKDCVFLFFDAKDEAKFTPRDKIFEKRLAKRVYRKKGAFKVVTCWKDLFTHWLGD